jgi:NTP pyrophosphatase (non-canonical NTP hydrolase)
MFIIDMLRPLFGSKKMKPAANFVYDDDKKLGSYLTRPLMSETEYDYELTVEEMLSDMKSYQDSIADIAMIIHQLNKRWWFDKDGNKLNRNKGELLALIHSEVSECLEGERKGLMDDHLPYRKMAEVELADIFIRLLDYAEGFGYDIAGAIVEKLFYNNSRKDHTYEEREKANGKKF